MVWCHEKKIIFIHIPKTGGSTIESNLDLKKSENGWGTHKFKFYPNKKAFQHFIWSDYIFKLGEETCNKYYKFTIVRHPVSRFISEYYWNPEGRKKCSFDDFLIKAENIVKNKLFKHRIGDHFQSQSSFIFDSNNNCKVDKIFRFENYNKVIMYIKELLNEKDKKIKSINVCKKNEKLSFIPSIKQMSKIYDLYKEDYDNFGYEKYYIGHII